mgnify:CR=1 FL=1
MLFQGSGRLAQGAGRIHQVVDKHAGLALDLADNIHDTRLVGARPALVDDGKIRIIETLGKRPRPDDTAYVRRYHDQ